MFPSNPLGMVHLRHTPNSTPLKPYPCYSQYIPLISPYNPKYYIRKNKIKVYPLMAIQYPFNIHLILSTLPLQSHWHILNIPH